MPHIICSGHADLTAAWRGLARGPWRWGKAVARTEGCYLSPDEASLLVAGVVVEYGRALHPVVVVSHSGRDTSFHLWSAVHIERTEGVKRFIAQVMKEMSGFGVGAVITTNIPDLI